MQCLLVTNSLQLHWRQFLVALLFADLPFLPPSFHEMILYLYICQEGAKSKVSYEWTLLFNVYILYFISQFTSLHITSIKIIS